MTEIISKPKYRALAIGLVGVIAIAAVLYVTRLSAAAGQEPPAAPATEADQDEGKAPIPVEVVVAETGEVSSYISATANLVPEDQVQILAETEGRVARVLAEEGDSVASGEVLALLDRDELEIARDKVALKATNARRAWERARDTLAKGLISTEEHDRLQLEHEVAQQELAEAEWKLDRTSIEAPFSGRVTGRMVTAGQHVHPGDPLFAVADFDPLVARIYLPEKDVLHLEEGRRVRITLGADESVRFAGRIRQISPVVDVDTGTVKVTVEAVRPPTTVRPGAFVAIDIVREHRSAALLLPREAVLRELGTAHVFVTDGATADRRDVAVGIEEGTMVEILSGVSAGERVVVAGQGGLKQGAKVKIL